MRRKMLFATGVVAVSAAVSAGSALAGPPDRADDPFVCPVLTLPEQATTNSDQFKPIAGGDYTLGPGAAGSPDTFNGNVPNKATNGDGAGSPGGAHSAPGDTDYTAIWSGN